MNSEATLNHIDLSIGLQLWYIIFVIKLTHVLSTCLGVSHPLESTMGQNKVCTSTAYGHPEAR